MTGLHHDIQVAVPSEGTHDYNTLPPGTYFWGWKPEGTPLLRVEGGYCSLVNGHVEHDAHLAYFKDKKVWPVPRGAKITINLTQPF